MGRLDARLEVRLDKQTFEQLERRAVTDHLSVAELVRQAITHELAGPPGDGRSWREQVLEKALSLGVPVPDESAELARELAAGYEPPGLEG